MVTRVVSKKQGESLPTSPLIVIAGPTGSGKSALAIRLAQEFAGEVVNCDSLQLYRGFDIGTAKTPLAERREIPHHLFDVLEPQEGYSAGEYLRAARAVVREISARGRVPILAGGTGFYLRALLEGLPPLPDRDEALRTRLAAKEARRPGALHRLLTRLAPAAAQKIHARDVQKTMRALEIRLSTHAAPPPMETADRLQGYSTLKIGLHPDRTELCARLDRRVVAMFESGLVDEVRHLLASGVLDDAKPFESLGYKQTLAYLRGQCTLQEAITSTQIETRQYAKRQVTWFRRDRDMHWIADFGDKSSTMERARELVLEFLKDREKS
jgi:tRNA dimethylallyltransferase